MSKKIDLAWMIRTGRARPGQWISGSLSWNCGSEPAGWISYVANMEDPYGSELRLSYWRGSGDDREHIQQTVRLVFTEPNYGGRRWWMVCPYSGRRAAKLYLPNGGDRFASRTSWRLGYNSQRVAKRDRALNRLTRLERKLGCEHDSWISRPKGMWQRTFTRHLERYEELDAECAVELARMVGLLRGRF